MSRTDIPKLVPGPTMAEVAAEYDHRRSELKRLSEHPLDDQAIAHLAKPRRTPEAQADIAAARAAPTAMEVAMQEVDRAAERALDEHRNAPTKFRSAHAPDCGHAMFQDDCATCHRQPTCCARRMNPMPDGTVWCDTCGAKRIVRTGDVGPAEVAGLETVLSNAAIADTPAVREMGGPRNMQADLAAAIGALEQIHKALWDHRDPLDVKLDDLVHGVVTLKIERDEARAHGERMRQELEQARQPGAIVLTGPEAERYRAIVAAARKAQASSAAARADGAALLQLFQVFCAGLAPGKEG